MLRVFRSFSEGYLYYPPRDFGIVEGVNKYIMQGIKILKELNLRPSLSQGYFFLGELYANTGRKDEALRNLNKALSMCQEMGIRYLSEKIQEVLDRL